MTVAVILAGHQMQLYISSTQRAENRPMVLDFQVSW